MIKIIKDGVISKNYKSVYFATCHHCGCEFEFEAEDCSVIERSIDGILQIRCPYCKSMQTFYKKSIEIREEEESE